MGCIYPPIIWPNIPQYSKICKPPLKNIQNSIESPIFNMKYPKFSPAHRESKSYPFQCFETPEIDLNFKVYSHRWRWIFNSDYYTPPKIRKWPKCDENPKYTPKDELGFAPLVPSSMHHPIKYISNNSFRSDKHRNAESNAENFFWVPPREKLEIYSTQNIIYYIFLHVWM